MQLAQQLVRKGVIAATELPRIAEAQAAAPSKPLHEHVDGSATRWLGGQRHLQIRRIILEPVAVDVTDVSLHPKPR